MKRHMLSRREFGLGAMASLAFGFACSGDNRQQQTTGQPAARPPDIIDPDVELRLVGAIAYHQADGHLTGYALGKGRHHEPFLIIESASLPPKGEEKGFAPIKSVAELRKIHGDFDPGKNYYAFCLEGWQVAIKGSSSSTPPPDFLPDVVALARAANGNHDYKFKPSEIGCEIQFRGGRIKKGSPTTSEGHGKDFKFKADGNEYPGPSKLTDHTVLHQLPQLVLEVSNGSDRFEVGTVGNAKTIWILNLSTLKGADPNKLEHFANYYALLDEPKVGVKPIPETTGLKPQNTTVTLPCGLSLQQRRPNNPPDSEFCIQAMV
jgi:hypothetical protein